MRVDRFNMGAEPVSGKEPLTFSLTDNTEPISKSGLGPGPETSGLLKVFVRERNAWTEYTPDTSKGFFTIGSGENDSIIISGENKIQKQHIAVRYAGGSWFIIERADKSVLFVNDVRKRQFTLKEKSSCVLKIESFTLLMTRDESRSVDSIYKIPDLPAPQFNIAGHDNIPAYLVLAEITENNSLGRKIILPPNGHSVSAGRDKDNYMSIENPRISRHHAQIITSTMNIILTDCESTNGTFVNGGRITRKLVLPGDIISLAGSEFLLMYPET